MTFIERALRVMTPIHIGASLGVAACLLLGSIDLVTAQPAARNHSGRVTQPIDSRSCGCAADLVLAESAR